LTGKNFGTCNKAAFNFGKYPMPYIGDPNELWKEFVETSVRTTCTYTFSCKSTTSLSDVSGNLTTLTHDLSGANLIRRDVGGTAPATEHYTQSPKDFGGLLAQYTTASGNSRFYYPDMADNIGLLAKGSATPERHQFQAFGPVYMSSTAPTTQPYGFGGNAGYYTEPISGLQIAWNRVYDANVGQWANRDPIGYEGGDWASFYRYVENNPARWSDPSGLDGVVTGPINTTNPPSWWPYFSPAQWFDRLFRWRWFLNPGTATIALFFRSTQRLGNDCLSQQQIDDENDHGINATSPYDFPWDPWPPIRVTTMGLDKDNPCNDTYEECRDTPGWKGPCLACLDKCNEEYIYGEVAPWPWLECYPPSSKGEPR
jgi:RHS repeat-associated protein